MSEPGSCLIINVTLPFGPAPTRAAQTNVRVRGERVTAVGEHLAPRTHEPIVDAHGAALLPGLHDHHLHLFALAASYKSANCALVRTPGELASLLSRAPIDPGGIVRAIGYSETLAGDLDRHQLDRLCPNRPVRVQHRSGALWILNTSALTTLGLMRTYLAHKVPHRSLELDRDGRPTGRIWRGDEWLRSLHPAQPPSLAVVGRELAALGVTGVTDATPHLDGTALSAIARAISSRELPQRVQLLHEGSELHHCTSILGPLKIVLPDHSLPELDALISRIREARIAGRSIAVHSVTLDSLTLALAALETVGSEPGDRIEHAAVVPQALISDLAEHRVTVVTQPGFIAHRGDELGADLGEETLGDLYRVASFLAAGVPVALSSDAPYGPLSPWQIIDATARRQTPRGAVLGPGERITAHQALERFLAPLDHPGSQPRRVEVGADADLTLLHHPLDRALETLPNNPVRATMIRGAWVQGI